MKTIILTICLVFLSISSGMCNDSQPYTAIVPSMGALSEWVVTFSNTYHDKNIYVAVEDVFKEGITPDEIVTNALEIEGLNLTHLIGALYCAGANYEDIRVSVENAGISDMILSAGYETAMTVCGDNIADTQAYTSIGPQYSGVPDGGNNGSSYGSPSTF